jgi:hypothetical protein
MVAEQLAPLLSEPMRGSLDRAACHPEFIEGFCSVPFMDM